MWKWKIKKLIILILISFCVKLWVWQRTAIVNTDAFEYINQAKLIYKGDIKRAKECGKRYLSLYHFLIAYTYPLFKDWIVCARIVSFLFSVLTTVPVFFICLLILEKEEAFFCTLVFSVNPYFSKISSDILKDQLFWFLFCWAIFFSLLWLKKEKNIYFLLSLILFLFSAFARIEGLIMAVVSPVLLLILKKKKRAIFFISSALFLLLLSSFKTWKLYLLPRLSLILHLKDINMNRLIEIAPHLLKALMVDMLLFPLLSLFTGGTKRIRSCLRETEFQYLFIISTISFFFILVFFVSVCYSKRYLSLFLFPFFFFLSPSLSIFLKKWENKKTFVFVFIILISLSFNLKKRRAEKLIYKEAAKYVEMLENKRPVLILAEDVRVSLYANRKNLFVICKREEITAKKKKLLDYAKKKNIRFILTVKQATGSLVLIKEWKKGKKRYKLYKINLRNSVING